MDSDSNPVAGTTAPVRRPRRLGLWFMGGFVLVFLGMLLLGTKMAMHPSGQYVTSYRLWEYYVITVPQAFGSSTVGPASSNTSDLFETMGLHLLASAVGGCAAAGVGWWLDKLRRPTA